MIFLYFSAFSIALLLATRAPATATSPLEVPTTVAPSSNFSGTNFSGTSIDEPICYMQMADGRVVDLTQLCGSDEMTQPPPGVAAQPSNVEYEPRDE